METLGTASGVPAVNKRRDVIRKKARRKGKAAAQGKMSKGAQQRISEKISALIKSGEYPNTPKGRARASATAYSMERAGRLRRHGKYIRKGK